MFISFHQDPLNLYPKGFPKEVDFSEDDHLATISYEDCFQDAQKAFLPYYSIVVDESTNDSKTTYHTYDTTYFEKYRVNSKGTLIDPITGWNVTKIYYFTLKCFEINPLNICKPIDLKTCKLTLIPLHFKYTSVINKMLKDSININIIEIGKDIDKQQMRRTQYILADLIREGEVFSHLQPKEKEQETLQWLWCSAQGSHKGVIELVDELEKNHPILATTSEFYWKELLLTTSKIRNMALPRFEREAIRKAMQLVIHYNITVPS